MNDKEFEFSISILVIDSDEATRRLLGDTMTALGYNTIQASSVDDGWRILDSQKIDLVMSDVFMPDGAGIKLLLETKKEKPQIPVVVLTAHADDTMRHELVDAGADGILTKPFRISKVEELIATTLLKYDRAGLTTTDSRRRILVVDDDAGVLDFLTEAVKALGYGVVAVTSAAAAISTFRKRRFSLVITDYMLSDSTGVRLLGKLKKIDDTIRGIIVTGYPLAYPPAMAKADGIGGYLVKPFRINQLEQVMVDLLYPRKDRRKNSPTTPPF